jgi:6-pyruvoyltetrahydropterin/6-carboxytetrahydropterin synthase
MYEISAEVGFSAAHHLRNYSGPCENVHGHNWLVRAHVRSAVLNECGIGIDFRDLRSRLGDVIGPLDHADLNAFFEAKGLNPSSENIARYVFKELEHSLPGESHTVTRVDVFETPTNCASYFEHA